MPETSILSPEQLDEFDRRGVLRLEGLISPDRAGAAREAVLRRLALMGLWQDGAWRLDALPRPKWPDSGLKASKAIGNKRPEIEALIEEPALLAVVDVLLQGHAFERAIFARPQVLFTLPNADTWTVPTGWHVLVRGWRAAGLPACSSSRSSSWSNPPAAARWSSPARIVCRTKAGSSGPGN